MWDDKKSIKAKSKDKETEHKFYDVMAIPTVLLGNETWA
jgi:hypothetical protein